MERNQISDVAQIYAVWNEYADSWSAGDMKRWLALWVEDGIQMPPDVPRNTGIDQINGKMKPLLDQYFYDMSINPDEVQVVGDRAYSHGLYTFNMTPKEGGETIEVSGKFLTILERQIDGSWKIAIDCFNYNAPI